MNAGSRPYLQKALFILFAFSGFSGLIYESIWTHYLKLFLGHAAYAQTLVLAIFMGGMATGAWMASRWMAKLKNPLMGYVAIELVIGLFGLLFHRIFDASSAWMLDTALPALGSSGPVELARWIYAALLILPQTLLLGATFPLMSSGLLRAYPRLPGSTISLLYFANSMGAVVGVLASGFWLIKAVGLPGTIMTAALSNFFLAGAVYFCVKRMQPLKMPASVSESLSPLERVLLLVSLVTGLSSFIYEVSWIRMLALVLGASTHAFELMLGAFILGLALGGLWVRRRIDSFAKPLRTLAIVQIVMGVLALGTIVAYNHMFDVMRFVMDVLQRNDAGYVLFNVSSHLIAMVVMVPVTFMAGMTLPLITYVLFRDGSGEAAIGRVYASNTFGAIIGVALSMQLLLPYLGLKAAITLGAGLDLLLGVWLLLHVGEKQKRVALVLMASLILMLTISLAIRFDTVKMASGVYRHGHLAQGSETLFHRDGRTATVDVMQFRDGVVSIITNGKPDASVMLRANQPPTGDEPTMILVGGAPLLYMPEIKTAAVIGMGSGLSASVLLTSPTLEHLDLVEIEAAMMEGARVFSERVERVYNDPRSHVHIDDAKSYFAAHHSRYDLIVSEPSNPWVSGVANLFSEEFYARIKNHLHEDGLLVQWFQLYEMSPDLMSSILKALSTHFSDYVIYSPNGSDVVLVAKKTGKLAAPRSNLFESKRFKAEFARAQWFNLADVEAHRLTDKALLEPFLKMSGAPANSDYFPFVDQHAVAARFKQERADFLVNIASSQLPVPGPYFLHPPVPSDKAQPIHFAARTEAIHAQRIARYFAGAENNLPSLPDSLIELLGLAKTSWKCENKQEQQMWRGYMRALMTIVLPRVDALQAKPMLAYFSTHACKDKDGLNSAWLSLFTAVAERDMPQQAQKAETLLKLNENDDLLDAEAKSYVMEAALIAHHQLGQDKRVVELARTNSGSSVITDMLAADSIQRLLATERAMPH